MLHAVYAYTTGVDIKWKGCNGTATSRDVFGLAETHQGLG